jgi:hypothetical protein
LNRSPAETVDGWRGWRYKQAPAFPGTSFRWGALTWLVSASKEASRVPKIRTGAYARLR